MSRFFKSAAFPILIVVVLAFFAQKLISPGPTKDEPNFPEFLGQHPTPPGTDLHAVGEGYVSITPVMMDLTSHDLIEHIASWRLSA